MEDTFKQYLIDENRKDYIPLVECIKGFLYKIHSRNLSFGVYDGNKGFIGIREKFNDRYLFTEYHHDTGAPYGTVKPFELICELPKEIDCNERQIHKYGSADWAVNPVSKIPEPVLRRGLQENEPQHGKRQGFVDEWAETKERLPDRLYPYVELNQELFNWLEEKELEFKKI